MSKISRDEAELLFMELANMPHYHVITTYVDSDNLTYTDGYGRVAALEYAAERIAPVDGAPDPTIDAIWIAEGQPRGCPLAHGDDDATGAESEFLADALEGEPYWSTSP